MFLEDFLDYWKITVLFLAKLRIGDKKMVICHKKEENKHKQDGEKEDKNIQYIHKTMRQ